MRRTALLLTLMGAILLAFGGLVLAQPPTPTQNVEDSYIVVFEEDGVQRPAAVANEHARAYGLQVRFVYTSALEGYAAVFPNAQALRRVQSDERVAYVEPDGVVSAIAQEGPTKAAKPSGKPSGGSSTASQTLPWGIDKVEADLSTTAAIGDGSGDLTGVNAYIIDTGIYYHADLNVVNHVNPSGAGGGNKDCNGHGTHVAGTVAAKDNTSDVVGVAPGAPLTGVKVLDCAGYGTWSGVIKGIDWVTINAVKPAIANMSLGGGSRQSVDDAVKDSADASDGDGGIFYSIAAGNDGKDACNYSPARAGKGTNGIATVAATNSSDKETSWSNYGSCVDIWAPGASILSTKKGGGTTTMSGTSMAAPHVGGGGALYLSKYGDVPPTTVEDALNSSATPTSNKSKDGRTITRENVSAF